MDSSDGEEPVAGPSSTATKAPKQKRTKLASQACLACRKGRTACSGTRPICARCTKLNKECSWPDPTEDARKPVKRSYVASLQQRIAALEAELEQARAGGAMLPNGADGTGGGARPERRPWMDGKPANKTFLMPQFLDNSGSLRMFGATSAMITPSSVPGSAALQLGGRALGPLPSSSSSGREGESIPRAPWMVPKFLPVPMTAEEHTQVLKASLDYCIGFALMLEPDLFLIDFNKAFLCDSSKPTNSWSPALHLAALALGSRLFPGATKVQQDGQPATEGLPFAKAAREELERNEFDVPALSTIKATALLAAYWNTGGKDGLAWLQFGNGVRIAQDMGLNFATNQFLNASALDAIDIEARSMTLWTTFVTDVLWAVWLGRRCTFRLEELYQPLPVISYGLDHLPWQPSLEAPARPGYLSTTFRATCELSIIAYRILNEVYFGSFEEGQGLAGTISKLTVQLEDWMRTLPSGIRLDMHSKTTPPHIHMLHSFYQTVIILLHRPTWYDVVSSPEARMRCERAAVEIVSINKSFDRCYGLGKMAMSHTHSSYVAGTCFCLLIAHATTDKDIATAEAGFTSCVNTLELLAKTWPFAQGCALALSHLRESTVAAVASVQPQSNLPPQDRPLLSHAPLPDLPTLPQQAPALALTNNGAVNPFNPAGYSLHQATGHLDWFGGGGGFGVDLLGGTEVSFEGLFRQAFARDGSG